MEQPIFSLVLWILRHLSIYKMNQNSTFVLPLFRNLVWLSWRLTWIQNIMILNFANACLDNLALETVAFNAQEDVIVLMERLWNFVMLHQALPLWNQYCRVQMASHVNYQFQRKFPIQIPQSKSQTYVRKVMKVMPVRNVVMDTEIKAGRVWNVIKEWFI